MIFWKKVITTMKKYIIFLIVSHSIFLIPSLQAQYFFNDSITINTIPDSLYYDLILKNLSPNSYFIVLNIDSPNYSGKVIIANGYLFNFLKETRKYSIPQYRNFMKDLLIKSDTLKTSSICFKKDELVSYEWGFYSFKEDSLVNYYASKGKKEFLNHYFSIGKKFGRIKKDIYNSATDKSEKTNIECAIINQLFKWEIPVKTDCFDGDLVIEVKK